ncbi:MAG: magnesium transporter [Candidatus Levybacteria bacterium]|nr:magnesium transporter [Candidatus Levybacteria bacterium]
MIYLSNLLNKNVFFERKIFGKMVDFAVLESSPTPSVSKIVVKQNGKKITISPSEITLRSFGAVLNSTKSPFLPYDERDFYLNEDLLDKQVIDIDDRRLVRVNDVVLEANGQLKVIGIDIGAAGIIRRLGLDKLIKTEPKIIPWQMIEAFDYQTGNVKISLSQNRLNKIHPSELADILENLGSKERVSIVESLDPRSAAKVIEETDIRTREAILEGLKASALGQVVAKMHVASIAGLFYKLNPLRIREILKLIGQERAQKVERVLDFGSETAGGMMRTTFWQFDGNLTVKETYNKLFEESPKPEAIVVTNGNEKLVGIIYTKDILDSDSLAQLKDIVAERKFVHPEVSVNDLITLFSRYNLRLLPIVDRDKKPIGVVKIDNILEKIEERTRVDELI